MISEKSLQTLLQVVNFKKLKKLKLFGNGNIDSTFLFPEIRESLDGDLVVEFLKSSFETAPWKKIQLIILGEGRIGKTTLLASLEYEVTKKHSAKNFKEVISAIQSTRSFDVDHYDFPTSDDVEIRVWDFGGQPEYAISHRNFMFTSQSVYWIAFDTSNPNCLTKLQQWLQYVSKAVFSSANLYVYQVAIFLIGTKWDMCYSQTEIMEGIAKILSNNQSLPIKKVYFTSAWGRYCYDYATFEKSDHKILKIPTLLEETRKSIEKYRRLPSVCKEIMDFLNQINEKATSPLDAIVRFSDVVSSLVKLQKSKTSAKLIEFYLEYFGRIGDIAISKKKGLVCTNPQFLSRLMTVFAAPPDVRLEFFPQPTSNWVLQGSLSTDEICRAIHRLKPPLVVRDKRDIDKIINILYEFEFCYAHNMNHIFPGLRTVGTPEFQFPPMHQKMFYAGWRIIFFDPMYLQANWIPLQLKFSSASLGEKCVLEDIFLHSMKICFPPKDKENKEPDQVVVIEGSGFLDLIILAGSPLDLFQTKYSTWFNANATYAPLCLHCLGQDHIFPHTRVPRSECVNLKHQKHSEEELSLPFAFENHLVDLSFSIPETASGWKKGKNAFLYEIDPAKPDLTSEEATELSRVMVWWNQMTSADTSDFYRDQYILEKVTLISNPMVASSFKSYYQNLIPIKSTEENKDDLQYERKKTRGYFLDFCKQFRKKSTIPEKNLVIGWWGNTQSVYQAVAETNFCTPMEIGATRLDKGYYGSGFYFTQKPLYSKEYLDKYYKGETSLLLSWLTLGNPRFVVESPLEKDQSLEGHIFTKTWDHPTLDASYTRHLDPPYSYNSHFVVVDKFGFPARHTSDGKSSDGILVGSGRDADEIVVFDKPQILPRCIVHFHMTKATVLWLDDKPENNAPLVKLIEKEGIQVIQFSSVEKVLLWMEDPSHKIYSRYPELKLRFVTNRRLFVDDQNKVDDAQPGLLYLKIREFHRGLPVMIFCGKYMKSLDRPHEYLFISMEIKKLMEFLQMKKPFYNFHQFEVDRMNKEIFNV